MVELLDAGRTVEEIAETLNREGVIPPGERRWSPADLAAAMGVDLAAIHRKVDAAALLRMADQATGS
ncbi:hypothetical protein FHR32_006086 [Streptosporangium album]|uniref:Uncharacterized protein n=1 Tax=Streptosporangium album TaxID=47479 RepID=A0A7W7S0L5_9ACTN|nr:hypothetical protein [Streptosporangium album]MBB4941709.1 hypothetical protein [Streptosporangium album]